MKQFITEVLRDFKNGRLTISEATDRLIAEKREARVRKGKSNRRLKRICDDLQREKDPRKVRELKSRLSDEFYNGDKP